MANRLNLHRGVENTEKNHSKVNKNYKIIKKKLEVDMAASRDRRNNAGNRYAKLLNEEEDEDDFYKTQYGGFGDEKVDTDYL